MRNYNTRQKECILEILKEHQELHITAAELGKRLEEQQTPVGTATIYRFLEQLVEEGLVRKYTLDGKSSACYQYMENGAACREHFHLKCLNCGTLFHVECEFLTQMQTHIMQHHSFRIDHTKTVLYGYCDTCRGAISAK